MKKIRNLSPPLKKTPRNSQRLALSSADIVESVQGPASAAVMRELWTLDVSAIE